MIGLVPTTKVSVSKTAKNCRMVQERGSQEHTFSTCYSHIFGCSGQNIAVMTVTQAKLGILPLFWGSLAWFSPQMCPFPKRQKTVEWSCRVDHKSAFFPLDSPSYVGLQTKI